MWQDSARYYEDVELGDDIEPLEKLPTLESVEDFCRIWGTPLPNRFTDQKIARKMKQPEPIAPAIMSMAWLAQLLTDWAQGDPMAIKRLDAVFRQPVLHNRPVTISGLVTDKRVEGGENLVECDVFITSQEGERLTGGRALLSLPNREG